MVDAGRPQRFAAFAAFTLYVALSFAFAGHPVALTNNVIGHSSDPYIFVWFFAWWPMVILHHLNPLFTSLLWSPLGVYTPWVTSVPLLALIGLPVTLLAGPVVTYNLFIIAAPALAAFCAYMLFRYMTKSIPASVIGGYLFGFSSYEMCQGVDALNLVFTMFVPLLLLAVLLRLNDEISRPRIVCLATLYLVCQFLVSVEIFALIFAFGGMAWLLAMAYLPARRQALVRLLIDGLLAGPLVALILSPFLLAMLAHPHYLKLPAAWPFYFTTDLLNVVLPGSGTWLGGGLFQHMNGHVLTDFQEQDGYLGFPLLLIILLFARAQGPNNAHRFALVLFLGLLIASFGPELWVYGHYTELTLPWRIFVGLPFLGDALPCRFAMFVSLAAAAIAALWIAQPSAKGRIMLGLLACLVLVPRPHPAMRVPVSTFFQPGNVQDKLGANARILILPFAINGPSSLWQETSGFSFVQTGGYLGFPPAKMQQFEAVEELLSNHTGRNFLQDLRQFVAATNTQYIVAGPGTSPAMTSLLAQLHWKMQQADDVMIYTVPQKTVPANG